MSVSIEERAARIRLLLMDVDGVLTDGRIYFVPDGTGGWTETKGFDSQDGIAMHWLHWSGIQTGMVSGRASKATELRAQQGKFSYCYTGNLEKVPILEEILAHSGFKPEQVAYIGDDFTDIVIMRRVGLAIAVANALPEVKRMAHYVTVASGGNGAMREVAVLILKAQGLWPEILKKYEIDDGQ
jgi:3-deoxy-D-manno-octulosonate 8-phosphate phosphatase (KDO 8-P phosphatase)